MRRQAPAAHLTLHQTRPPYMKSGTIVRLSNGSYWICTSHTAQGADLIRPPWFKAFWWELCDTFRGIIGYDDD